jgi:hypothetical protein
MIAVVYIIKKLSGVINLEYFYESKAFLNCAKIINDLMMRRKKDSATEKAEILLRKARELDLLNILVGLLIS